VIWIVALPIILGLSALVFYLQRSRNQLQIATERQLQLSGMLINAQEKERSRLASELHDDFSQRLALLALGLETAAETIPASPQEAQHQLHELLNAASEIGADLHTLSHRLHSSTLESLGLVPAVTAFCKEFGSQQGVKIQFTSDGVPQAVERDTALCVFRIVQEALRNLKKHSGATGAQVDLGVSEDKLTLAVEDRGRGFDLAELHAKQGLGIRSMEERARVLGGEFQIQSEPGRGTTVKAWVPLRRGEPGGGWVAGGGIDRPRSLR
jgi:signal transduction histidine kinase